MVVNVASNPRTWRADNLLQEVRSASDSSFESFLADSNYEPLSNSLFECTDDDTLFANIDAILSEYQSVENLPDLTMDDSDADRSSSLPAGWSLEDTSAAAEQTAQIANASVHSFWPYQPDGMGIQGYYFLARPDSRVPMPVPYCGNVRGPPGSNPMDVRGIQYAMNYGNNIPRVIQAMGGISDSYYPPLRPAQPLTRSTSSESQYTVLSDRSTTPEVRYCFVFVYKAKPVIQECQSRRGQTAPVDRKKPVRKVKHVNRACVHCKRAHLACDEARPCRRCIHLNKSECVDVEHKKRGRPRVTA